MKILRTTEEGLMTKIIIILLLFILLSFEIGYADSTSSLWVTTYGGTEFFADEMRSVRQTSDGGYIIAGETNSFGESGDAWVMKLDKDGNVDWQKTYGGIHSDVVRSVQECFSGNTSDGYIMAGETYSYGDGYHSDAWVFKLDNDGNIVRQKIYSDGSGTANSIQQTSDGGYIVAGETDSNVGAGGGDSWIFKLDANGNMEWQKTYGGDNSDVAYSVQQTFDGGYIVTGLSAYSDNDEVSGDAFVLKLSNDGNVEWQKSYGGDNYDAAKSIMQTSDDGFIVAGETYSFGNEGDAWAFKVDKNGTIEWQMSYGGDGFDTASSIQQTFSADGSDDGYIVAGETNSFGAGDGDSWVIKLDMNGGIVWQNTYGSTGHDLAHSIQQTFDENQSPDGYIVVGASLFSEKLSYDAWTLRIDENGNVGDCSSVEPSNAASNPTSATSGNINMTGSDTTVPTEGINSDASSTDTKADSATMTLCRPGSSIYILTVIMDDAGTGNGNVVGKQKDEDGNLLINCGSNGTDCKMRFETTTVTKVTLTAKADIDSIFVGWSGDGCNGRAKTCTVPINQSRNVTATFDVKEFTIKSSAGTGGTIVPAGVTDPSDKTRVNYGSQLKYIIATDDEYEVARVKVDNRVVDLVTNEYTFGDISANHKIQVSFKLKTYKITKTVTPEGAGTISPKGDVLVKSGKGKKFTIKAKKRYNLVSVLVNGEDKGATSTFTFTDVKSDQTIEAIFAPK